MYLFIYIARGATYDERVGMNVEREMGDGRWEMGDYVEGVEKRNACLGYPTLPRLAYPACSSG